ncbi:MAG: hypothetical protein WBP16_11370, partial [Ferruginibacter sp.]
MSHLNKGKAKYILLSALVLLLYAITPYRTASGFSRDDFHSFLTTDTVPVKGEPLIQISKTDSLQLKNNVAEPL